VIVFRWTPYLLFLGATCCAQPSPLAPRSTVRFYVPDEYGRPAPYSVHEFYASGLAMTSYTHLFRGTEAHGIPYGRYRYTLVRTDLPSPKLSTINGNLVVRLPEHWVSVEQRGVIRITPEGKEAIVDFHDEPATVRGSFLPKPALAGRNWVRVYGPSLAGVREAALSNDGRFTLDRKSVGWHILVLMNDGRPIQADPILIPEVPESKDIQVQFRAKAPLKRD